MIFHFYRSVFFGKRLLRWMLHDLLCRVSVKCMKQYWCYRLPGTVSEIKRLLDLISRSGVLKDVFGLEDTFWRPWPRRSSPWPWPRNCPVLDSWTALFFEPLKFCRKTRETSRKIFENLFCIPLLKIAGKFYLKTFFFFWRTLARLCPWPRGFLSLASSLMSSTPPLMISLSFSG